MGLWGWGLRGNGGLGFGAGGGQIYGAGTALGGGGAPGIYGAGPLWGAVGPSPDPAPHSAAAPPPCPRRPPPATSPRPPRAAPLGPAARAAAWGAAPRRPPCGAGAPAAWWRPPDPPWGRGGLPHSRVYDPRRPQTFFQQCFQLLGTLGRGSFGEVYKVRSREDGALYAVKRTTRPFRGPRDRRRALAEARRHRAVGRHPQCVGLVAAWEERGVLYLQSELCPGGSLGGAAAGRGPLPAWRALAYLGDLLQALRHLHARRMAHGDVKPANALLGPGGVRLADFGLLGEGGGGEGDPRYLAPEVLGGGPRAAGPPADVFSLGLTLLEVAAGRELPAAGEGWQELRRGGLPPDMARGLTPELRELLAAMLEPDPQRRPSAEALLRTAPLRRAGRWRALTRLADEGLRRGARLMEGCRAALRWVWGALWGVLWGTAPWRRPPATPPRSPLPPPGIDWDEEEEEEVRWVGGAPGSPSTFPRTASPCSTPRHGASPPRGTRSPEGSPTAVGRLRRTLTFEEEPEAGGAQ
ncbi:LOW QUALITY PROTEIN: membrane-associated tyrosine- and threonine-specific cdc2-inhibitory kinase [Anser cygnoides]|uniref:LOW QUALITY PROTEIN: membrane-associated tyrosine- and threonine-specific cdc2-inhibitory kinase n=1 Tax=Anser cygnoides TaxID=8845 RepID=UPI0034D1B1D2